MKKTKHTEEKIIAAVKQMEAPFFRRKSNRSPLNAS